ncbi:WbqC family protein [Alcanivorax sp. DP30]|uniref:WbqC family protein n=1 Tax=Alcanivorax sp. DP30 TaxID=2606217 RepID=UPI00136D1AD9|nr:WbqC family protein [Alcanivorax sp. DP30]MZR64149.1 hypothetical protein [Alcanivorax sp. DP30]
MRLALMQPYLFPYIGYYQLVYAADLFLVYDDVAYIKQGYINRNSILNKNGVTRFTVPVPGASSFKMISELSFSEDVRKVQQAIQQSYSKSPYFDAVFPMINEILEHPGRSIADLCMHSFKVVFSYLGIEKEMLKTSDLEYERSLSAQDRILALCEKFGADTYINVPGGRKLYLKQDFEDRGVDLQFIGPEGVSYAQRGEEFVPDLSMIDILMNCSADETVDLLKRYTLS